ncbi:hypothetical protein M9458_035546 [Cirrhinus mrigala]|uniref:Gypsy retrotransposon integrase-like protein 1 n=1 Tax=Cirrhinus mrigala TaxID=683832 RepID=A0ABD0PB68_CIRMR
MLAAASGWNEIALLDACRQGINPETRAAMALYDDSIGLESFLQRTTRVSQRLATCQPPVTAPQSASVAACFPVPEPMQVDSTRLSCTERNCRIALGLFILWSSRSSHPQLSSSTPTPSGSFGNFIAQECLNQLQLSRQRHSHEYAVKTIQGKPLGCGRIRHSSPFIILQVGLFNSERIRFPDALARQFSPDTPSDPEPIIPSNLIVSPIIWDLDREIQQATLKEPALLECPEGKTYVPRSKRQTLLGTAHRSPGSGHPGSRRTLLLQSRYWWPSMHRDTIMYVQSCSVCAKSNSPRQLPTGKLVPLPIPQRPWFHLAVDFVTDLPNSKGNTCVLVIVDHLSKSCKLVPLKGLPMAMETAKQLFHQVFRHFGLPEEIVLDRGPQFISCLESFLQAAWCTNGQTERKIQELGRYLRAYCHEDQHSWSRFLLWAEYAQNSLRQDTTGLTPFQKPLMFQLTPSPAGSTPT